MKELDKLVENYFTEKKAPELGMDMLLEMVEQSLEEIAVTRFGIGSGMTLERQVMSILQTINPDVRRKTTTTGKSLHLTNFGNAINRDKAIKFLKKELEKLKVEFGEEIKYERNDDLAVGLKIGGSSVVLSDGRTHTKENIFFKQLEQTLKGIQDNLVADVNKQ